MSYSGKGTMANKEKLLKRLRATTGQLEAGTIREGVAAATLKELLDEFVGLGLGASVRNEAHGPITGNLVQFNDQDPKVIYRAFYAVIEELQRGRNERIADLPALIDELAKLTSSPSTHNSVSRQVDGTVIQMGGDYHGDINL